MSTKRAILTITRNSSHIFHEFIEAIQDYTTEEIYDLYLYDNGSRPGDVEYLESFSNLFKIQIFDNKNVLFTKAANSLIRVALDEEDYEQIILLNPDVIIKENWDKDLEENKGIQGFLLIKEDQTIEHAGAYGGGEHIGRGELDEGQYSELREVDWVTFGAVGIHRDVINKIGFLEEETYPHFGSDREYCHKAREAGFTVSCSPARLTHYYGFATRPYLFREVPREIWKRNIEERRSAGVYFPDGEEFILKETKD